MESSLWLPFDHQVMPLSTLCTTSKDVFGGSLFTSLEEKIQDLGEGYCYKLHAKTNVMWITKMRRLVIYLGKYFVPNWYSISYVL